MIAMGSLWLCWYGADARAWVVDDGGGTDGATDPAGCTHPDAAPPLSLRRERAG